jgi:hypothetical protein
MSSMNTMTNMSNSGMNTEFIRYMKCAEALVSSNNITKYSYNPYLVENAVLGTSSGWIHLGEDLNTGKLIKENVDAGQWIFILGGDSI